MIAIEQHTLTYHAPYGTKPSRLEAQALVWLYSLYAPIEHTTVKVDTRAMHVVFSFDDKPQRLPETLAPEER